MKLYLARHGEAVSDQVDPLRPLTDKGKSTTLKIANLLKDADCQVDIIFHSTKKRARQTAEIFKNTLNPKCQISFKDYLSPNDPVDKIYQEIIQYDHLMIVGHLPFLFELLTKLMNTEPNPRLASFSVSSVAILERDERQNWKMIDFISADKRLG